MKIKQLLLVLLFITILSSASAKGVVVKGIVTDSITGVALTGVKVSAEGTSIETVTDTLGQYRLMIDPSCHFLVFSLTDYIVRKVEIKGKTQLDITLALKVVKYTAPVVVDEVREEVEIATMSSAMESSPPSPGDKKVMIRGITAASDKSVAVAIPEMIEREKTNGNL